LKKDTLSSLRFSPDRWFFCSHSKQAAASRGQWQTAQ
jgi:hypothetical protein